MTVRLAVVCALLSVTMLAGCSSKGGNEIAIHGSTFSTSNLTIKAGEHVTFVNHDGIEHTATADDGYFDSGNLHSGATYEVHFAEAGTHPFHCKIHPGMTGTITVT